uniref:F-box domain-containing protein n=1 Tax=Araucaria cunninghamii TaxID=56994 RepID=A0A0D6QU62_ARACU
MARPRMEGAKLIPGLPDEIAELCLLRVPHIYHYALCRVSPQWKNLVDSPSFLSIRKELGFSNTSLFLLPKRYMLLEEMEMKCWQVDLDTYDCISSPFPIPENVTLNCALATNKVCVGVGRKVLLIDDILPAVYQFNTHFREWERGSDMLNRRIEFAYGVIEDRLYVAGGKDGSCTGKLLKSSEVFDPHSNAWFPIANLPLALKIRQFLVYEKSLFVIGRCYLDRDVSEKAFSYNPLRDEWQEQPWALAAERSFPRLFITAPSEEECLYGLLIRSDGSGHLSPKSRKLSVFRYEKIMSKWEPVLSFTEQIPLFHPFNPSKRSCRGSSSVDVKAYGLKKKVLILQHFNDDDPKDKEEADGFTVSPPAPEDKVARVFVGCPKEWHVALLHA